MAVTAFALGLPVTSALANTPTLDRAVELWRGTFLGRNELGNDVMREPADQGGRKYVLKEGPRPYTDTRYYSDKVVIAELPEQLIDKTTRNSIAIEDPKIARFVKANSVRLTDWEMYNAYVCGETVAQVCLETNQGWQEQIFAYIRTALEDHFPLYRDSDGPEIRWMAITAYQIVATALAKHQIAVYSKEMKEGTRFGDH
jgi:hypothetical protein